MHLLRLLTAGRSLKAGRKAGGRYRLPKSDALPQLSQTKPLGFRSTTRKQEKEQPLESVSSPALLNASDGEKETVIQPRTTASDRGRDPFAATPAPAVSKPASASRSRRRTSWMRKLNPFSARSPREIDGSTQPAPVQGELSLDNVKPIRNDLSDADLELVSVVQTPRQKKSDPSLEAEPAAPGTVWGRLAGKLFETGRLTKSEP